MAKTSARAVARHKCFRPMGSQRYGGSQLCEFSGMSRAVGDAETGFEHPEEVRETTLSFRGASVASEPGIHNHDRDYGFRACAKWRIPAWRTKTPRFPGAFSRLANQPAFTRRLSRPSCRRPA